jgi:hypothetical protein
LLVIGNPLNLKVRPLGLMAVDRVTAQLVIDNSVYIATIGLESLHFTETHF